MAAPIASRMFVAPMATGVEPSVLALAFDTQVLAHQALHAALGLQEDHALVVHDAVVIDAASGASATIVATMDPLPFAAAVPASLIGAVVGTLLAGPLGLIIGGVVVGGAGALAAKLADIGIPTHVVEELRAGLQPGLCLLALLISERKPGAMVSYAMRCGTVGRSTILPCV
jgi:uncharacterized membrane protein